MRLYMREQWRRMRRVEREQCLRFDHVVAVSPEDAAVFREQYGVERVSSVPTGVDTDFFRPVRHRVAEAGTRSSSPDRWTGCRTRTG